MYLKVRAPIDASAKPEDVETLVSQIRGHARRLVVGSRYPNITVNDIVQTTVLRCLRNGVPINPETNRVSFTCVANAYKDLLRGEKAIIRRLVLPETDVRALHDPRFKLPNAVGHKAGPLVVHDIPEQYSNHLPQLDTRERAFVELLLFGGGSVSATHAAKLLGINQRTSIDTINAFNESLVRQQKKPMTIPWGEGPIASSIDNARLKATELLSESIYPITQRVSVRKLINNDFDLKPTKAGERPAPTSTTYWGMVKAYIQTMTKALLFNRGLTGFKVPGKLFIEIVSAINLDESYFKNDLTVRQNLDELIKAEVDKQTRHIENASRLFKYNDKPGPELIKEHIRLQNSLAELSQDEQLVFNLLRLRGIYKNVLADIEADLKEVGMTTVDVPATFSKLQAWLEEFNLTLIDPKDANETEIPKDENKAAEYQLASAQLLKALIQHQSRSGAPV